MLEVATLICGCLKIASVALTCDCVYLILQKSPLDGQNGDVLKITSFFNHLAISKQSRPTYFVDCYWISSRWNKNWTSSDLICRLLVSERYFRNCPDCQKPRTSGIGSARCGGNVLIYIPVWMRHYVSMHSRLTMTNKR